MSAPESVDNTLPSWAEWLLGLWIFGSALIFFLRFTLVFYRAHESAIDALFQ